MFINIKILSKNQNSLKKFLINFNAFCLKKQSKKNLYEIKIKGMREKKVPRSLFNTSQQYTHYKYKIKKRKYKAKQNLSGFLRYFPQNRKRKVFTTLKSPHVNKIAQEQIEYRLFSKQINIFSFQILKFIILVKKIQTKICPDVEIQIKFVVNNKVTLPTKLVSLNPENYKITPIFFKNNKKKSSKELAMLYLKLFDIYGELNFNILFR